ncbi:MAG: YraN family protein [Gammaproteobacteria bacterium]|nr:YraN family protein [Gammaproteobacteria bacterium]
MQGRRFEALARAYLERHGLRHVTSNFRSSRGELDLVMRDGPVVVFVEVRYRRDARFGSAAESVDPRKQARLVAAAEHYLQRRGDPAARGRFDVVAISGTPPTLAFEWIRDAFQA